MTEYTPKTIQIFLPEGNPRGVRLAEITSRTVLAIQIPRASLTYAGKRSETSSVGAYLLVSHDENDEIRVYVGEAEDCYKRLTQHNSSKEFWSQAIVFTSQKQQFTKSHVKYLEWYCLTKIQEAGRATIENATMPSRPYVPEPVVADLIDSFDTIRILTSSLGFPIFESLRDSTPDSSDKHLYVKTKSADACGEFTDEGFVLFQGSRCNPNVSNSLSSGNLKRRNSLLESGVLKEEEDYLVITKDHLFSSPSSAGAAVLGRENNGWTTWRYANGKTLAEVHRPEESSEETD